ncbi:hypothetical protein PAXINDRAFT_152556 [Paxillus involutus ATCC 200175]|nr:hypothetical protein PAXINDRAFT_152556 [Paxillus involutus ATCC 200175]
MTQKSHGNICPSTDPDGHIQEQIGGGCRHVSPIVKTPTKLRTVIKPTTTKKAFNIPSTHVIPLTPTMGLSSIFSSETLNMASDDIDMEDLTPAEATVPSPPTTPTSGRRSAETNHMLEASYAELDGVLERLATETLLSPQQIADNWHRSRGHVINSSNHWNIYKAYFKVNKAQEQTQVGLTLEDPVDNGKATPNLSSRCYKAFKAYHGSVWSEILEVFEMAEMTKNINQTFSQWAQTFNKLQRRVIELVDARATKHGFQAAVIMCGNTVNEDASLGFAHTTPGATEVTLPPSHD